MLDLAHTELRIQNIQSLREEGHFRLARSLARDAAAEVPPPGPRDGLPEALALARLAEACRSVGEGRWARSLLERAIKTVEKRSGPDEPRLVRLLLDLVRTLEALVYYPEVEPVLTRALSLAMRLHGEASLAVAEVRLAWADVWVRHWHAASARPLLRQVRPVLDRELPADHGDRLMCEELDLLATKESLRPDSLVSALDDVLARRVASLGPHHPHSMRLRTNLVELEPDSVRAAGRYEEALRLARSLGPDDPAVALVHVAWAAWLMREDEPAVALDSVLEALRGLEAAWAADHPDRMTLHGRLTMLLTWLEPSPAVLEGRSRLAALRGPDGRPGR